MLMAYDNRDSRSWVESGVLGERCLCFCTTFIGTGDRGAGCMDLGQDTTRDGQGDGVGFNEAYGDFSTLQS